MRSLVMLQAVHKRVGEVVARQLTLPLAVWQLLLQQHWLCCRCCGCCCRASKSGVLPQSVGGLGKLAVLFYVAAAVDAVDAVDAVVAAVVVVGGGAVVSKQLRPCGTLLYAPCVAQLPLVLMRPSCTAGPRDYKNGIAIRVLCVCAAGTVWLNHGRGKRNENKSSARSEKQAAKVKPPHSRAGRGAKGTAKRKRAKCQQ